MNEILRTCQRTLWGDYGHILLQGQYDDGRNCYRGFVPRSRVTLTNGNLLVDESAKESLLGLSQIGFRQCDDVELYDFDWRPYSSSKRPPIYPPGGEPQNYFNAGFEIADSIPLWLLTVDEFVELERPGIKEIQESIRVTLSVPVPKLPEDASIPDAPIFAARYSGGVRNIAYYLRPDAVVNCDQLFGDAVVLE